MTTLNNPTLRVAGPAELLAVVPYLIGFHPHESLVIVGLADDRLVVTARLDLSDLGSGQSFVPRVITALVRGGARQLVGAVFTATTPAPVPGGSLPHAGVAAGLDTEAARAGVQLLDCLLVSGDRWWSYTCREPGCCPVEGSELPAAPTPVDAAAVYAGLRVLPDRQALVDCLGPLPDRADLISEIRMQERIESSVTEPDSRRRYVRSVTRALFAAHRAAQAGGMPGDTDAARYGVALQTDTIRDALWLAVDGDRLPGTALWVDLARRLPSPYDAAPAFLAGWRAYRDGNGALARIAADRALDSDPDYSAAALLRAALTNGIDPRTLPKLRARMPHAEQPVDTP